MRNVLEKGGSFGGINRKVQIKPIKVEEGRIMEALVVLKWGGNLTNLGREQVPNHRTLRCIMLTD